MRNNLILLLLFSFYTCHSTVQRKDVLIYNDESYQLKNYYLEDYFESFPEKRPKSGLVSSDLWRGYLAIFKVLDDDIYLVDLQIRVVDNKPNEIFARKWISVFDEFSPDCDKFLVDWIDDLIILPVGEVLDYERGFGVSFKDYNLLEVKEGRIINSKTFSLNFYRKHFKKCHFFMREEDLLKLSKKLF